MRTDLFRLLGSIALLTLILVIAVKLAQQSSATASATPSPKTPSLQSHGVCGPGLRPDQNGDCVKDY